MERSFSVHLKSIPEKVFDLILDRQLAETKKKKQKINRSQVVIMMLKEAYCKEK
jgi:hypothetical protein